MCSTTEDGGDDMSDTELYGWNGKILRVNLSTGQLSTEPLQHYREYIGGRGLGVKYIYDEVPPGTDPLSAENKVIITTGPLTATAAQTSGRFSVVSKSPLTGTIFDSNSGGFFGPELKKAGWDAVMIEGKADKPVYLHISDSEFSLEDASDIWGKDYHQTKEMLHHKHDKHRVMAIGPAGENMVNIAAIMNDEDRAAGRGGLAAVLGHKKLKAVVVRGTGKVRVAEPEKLKETVARVQKAIKKNPVTNNALPTFGTSVLVNVTNQLGMLPTNNFQRGTFNDAEGISGEKIAERILTGKYACYSCPIACGRRTKTSHSSGEGPEYETAWAFGADIGNSNLELVAEANYMCNELGLDTISTGSTIACTMELVEKGRLSGFPTFGEADTKGLLDIIKSIAYRDGLGDQLAEGSLRLAAKYGAPELAMVAKGMEVPAYDPRGAQGMGLAYATSNRGGCHLRAYMVSPEVLGQPCQMDRFSIKGKADVCKMLQDMSAFVDSTVMCRFTEFAFSTDYYSELVSAATGLKVTPIQAMTIGERIWNLERMYNNAAGFTAAHDTLPPRFLEEELPEGGSRKRVVRLARLGLG
jgi:aldehyde:ferredoxin oxidoreductase